ncbi:ribonuclease III [uncultured Coprobacter sp.]|uniref:ribonuclease III n=1 Tax=uncultured Coprobacter sp. TaxID=1720550 RepID=UPI0025D0BF31|nr:ribonuclease III [uncultured Coprobacter sp.]
MQKHKESYSLFYQILGFYPNNIKLYEQAFVHRSSDIRTQEGQRINNERLEFLGDAVLSTIVADILFKKFPNKKEGFLSNTRSKIVKRDTLNDIAIKMGLDKLVQTSIRTNTHNNYIYGNAFEAFIGAIYLDQGYEICKTFIQDRIIAPYIDLSVIARKEVNFKSKLIEWGQKNHIDISFSLIEAFTDKENNPIFQFQAILAGTPCGIGIGYSKKEAQQNAAQIALTRVKNDQTFAQSILNAQKSFELNLSKKENDGNFREQFSSFTKQDSSDKSYEF